MLHTHIVPLTSIVLSTQRLLPKLKAEIPKWAERLRFLHSEVLKWQAPDRILEEESELKRREAEAHLQAEQAAASEGPAIAEWVAPAEANPEPSAEELELLRMMGWGDEEGAAGDAASIFEGLGGDQAGEGVDGSAIAATSAQQGKKKKKKKKKKK
jgi:hypothetical protein